MTTSTITSKGQTTIPLEIRKRLNLQSGDRVNYVVEGDRVYLEPANVPVEYLSGKYQHLARCPSISVEEIDKAIATAIVESLEDQ